jgi:hypothetical protein
LKTNFIFIILSAIFLTKMPVLAEDQEQTAAIQAASTWLQLIDAGNYAEAWKQAAPVLQQNIPQDKWQEMVKTVELKVGKIISRKVLETTFSSTLPDAPKGNYAIILYATSFQNMPQGGNEKITLMKTENTWKVAGYFIM